MDWVHCNNCFQVPCVDRSFYLTSCGHIYCRDCEEKCARGQCKLCGNQCSAIVLSASMKPDVQKFFTDPDELLKKKLKEVQQVSEFQKNHRARLVAHQRKQLKKFDSVKQDFRKLLKNLKEVENERKHLSQENNVLKKVLKMNKSPKSVDFSNSFAQGNINDSHPLLRSSSSTVAGILNEKHNLVHQKAKNQRVSVLSPPTNGKLGVIQGTPSPSSLLRGLCLSSVNSNESVQRSFQQSFSLESSPSGQSTQSMYMTPTFPCTQSPSDSVRLAELMKRKKMVVHPFSPDT